jgi:serine/threonine-protein phosphatase 2A regulatory subunit A
MPAHQLLLHNDWIINLENWCLGADQDSVRLLAVEGCAALGKLLEPADCVANILPVIVDFSQDKSWRVRYMVANQLYELCAAVGPEPTR